MLNGARSQAVDGTMGVHMPCPYTLARPAVGARWVGGRWRWWGSSVVPPPPLKAPTGLLRPPSVGGLVGQLYS